MLSNKGNNTDYEMLFWDGVDNRIYVILSLYTWIVNLYQDVIVTAAVVVVNLACYVR